MRIVIAHSRLTGLGGGERCTLELLRYLAKDHEVTLWTGRQALDDTYSELAAYPRRELSPAEWLTARPAADVVVAQSYGAYLLALRHPRVICYLHTMRSRYLIGGNRPDLVARRWLDHRALRRASRLLTNSHFTASLAERRYGRIVEVIPPGVDEILLDQPARVGDYALYVGRLAPEKGLERLLAWSRGLREPLRIVGDGQPDYVRHLRSLAAPQVEFVGPLTGIALIRAYAGCRFFTFTPHAEEFGMAALEAMAAAKPVIASAEGGTPELVHDGVTGFLVRSAAEFAHAAERLEADDALCQRMGQAGRDVARAYTWDGFASRIEVFCAEIAAYTPSMRPSCGEFGRAE